VTDAEFERFHAETAAPLHAYLARVGGDDALADDLVQTTYLRILRARALPRDARTLRLYLFRTATNLLRDEFRRSAGDLRRTKRLAAAAAGDQRTWGIKTGGHAAALDFESRIDTRRAFARMSARDRELLWLAYVVGLSHREISGVAGVGEPSVRVLLLRARRRFASLLTEHGIGPADLT
jgi:RNA polymerase sigma-70 factor (ECF subfamily)